MSRKHLAVLLFVPLLFAAGCSSGAPSPDGQGPPSPTASTLAPASSSPVMSPNPPGPPVQPGSPVQQPPAATSHATPSVAGPTGCQETSGWNTADDAAPRIMTQGEVFDVRPGRHECFDQITFDVATTAKVGFVARYVPVATQDGSGFEVPVAGGAVIQLSIDAPSPELLVGYGYKADWPALKEIKFAGSFEGMTTFAIGVASVRPFAVEHHPNGDTMRVVVYIAH